MAELSSTSEDASLSATGVLRERLRHAKRSVVGQALGKSDSWPSKLLDSTMGITLDEIPKLLDVLGLKLVDAAECTVDRGVFESYRTLAMIALTDPESLKAKA